MPITHLILARFDVASSFSCSSTINAPSNSNGSKRCVVDNQRCHVYQTRHYRSVATRRRSTKLNYSDDALFAAWSSVIDIYERLKDERANEVDGMEMMAEDDHATRSDTTLSLNNNDDEWFHDDSSNGQASTIVHRDYDDIVETDTPGILEFVEKETPNVLESGDDWSSSIDERRNQRIQSLDSFNEAQQRQQQNQRHQQQQQQNQNRQEQKLPKNHNHPAPPQLNLPYNDRSQLQAIQSNAPAILLSSGPGTGKSHVLALRIAYLLRMQLDYETNGNNNHRNSNNNHDDPMLSSNTITPDSMVILSFTNQDAERLKENALDYLFPTTTTTTTTTVATNALYSTNQMANDSIEEWREITSRQLWSGTVHMFALAILRKYGYSDVTPLRVLPARAMRNRVSQSLRTLLNGGEEEVERTERSDSDNAVVTDQDLFSEIRMRQLRALHDVGQSRSILYQSIVKCIDLWKEALLIPSTTTGNDATTRNKVVDEQHRKQKEVELRNDCVELAMRLGIPKSSALLALDVFPSYQARHAAAGTADPSDLAGMAYRLLLAKPEALHVLRAKLKHIIVDEYQDISVSQHALLRLVVRGKTDDDPRSMPAEESTTTQRQQSKSQILEDSDQTTRRATLKKRPRACASLNQHYNVPNLFAAGDTKQSIYGWRAAAPSFTVDGFRRDYPQGVVAALGKDDSGQQFVFRFAYV